MAPTRDFLLVIPAYEEHLRLPPFLGDLLQHLADTPYRTRIQIVDDGSSEGSLRELAKALHHMTTSASIELLPVLKLHPRRGKGSAIHAGWNLKTGARWLAFVDADGAIPAGEIRRIFDLIHYGPETMQDEAYLGIRASAKDRKVERDWLRKRMGNLFILLVQLFFQCPFQDPQCGFKVIPSRAWQSLAVRSHEKGFCFDLELLLLLRSSKTRIVEIPIAWHEKLGGHFTLIPDGIITFVSSARLWFRSNLHVGQPGKTLASR